MFMVILALLLGILSPDVAQACVGMEEIAGTWRFSGVSHGAFAQEWVPTDLELEIEFANSGSMYFYRSGVREHATEIVLSCSTLQVTDVHETADYGPVSGSSSCNPIGVFFFDEDLTSGGTHPCDGDVCLGFAWGGCTDSPHWIYERVDSVSAVAQTWGALKARY